MNKPYLGDISDLTRLLLVFGLLVAAAAQVISHMIGRRSRVGLPQRLLGFGALGILAVVGLIAKPELGNSFVRFVYENVVERIVPPSEPPPDAAKRPMP